MHLNVKHYTLNNTIYIMRMKDNVAAPPQDAPTFMVLSNNRRHRTNLGAFVFGVPVACTNKLVGWYGQCKAAPYILRCCCLFGIPLYKGDLQISRSTSFLSSSCSTIWILRLSYLHNRTRRFRSLVRT